MVTSLQRLAELGTRETAGSEPDPEPS